MMTVVLLNWRRPYHLPRIVEHLRGIPEIDDIVIWDNSGCLPDVDGCLVLRAKENICTLGRFEAAKNARHELIFSQDDDLLVQNAPELLDTYLHPENFGVFSESCHNGPSAVDSIPEKRIVANLADDQSSRHWTFWQIRRPAWCELGFGSIWPREWAFSLNNWPYDQEVLKRKADKIFGVLHPWQAIRAGKDEITRLYYDGKESGRDSHALSKRADHRELTERAVQLAKQWKETMGP